MKTLIPALILAAAASLAIGCGSRPRTDYTAYLRHMPRSILVLPPVNHTAAMGATEAFVATITTPLAEHGYYVFPVVLVDRLMKENGLPLPGDMRQAPLHKLGEVFGADAVLYIDILDWETKYIILDASTHVTVRYRLVDVATATPLWQWEQTQIESTGAGQINPVAMLVTAAAHQITSGMTQRERDLAILANHAAITNPRDGMLLGHRHPAFQKDQQRRRKAAAD